MSKTIHIELTEQEARAHILAHSIASAILAGHPSRGFLLAAECMQMGDEFAELYASATRKICSAIDSDAVAQADYIEGNRQAAQERRN